MSQQFRSAPQHGRFAALLVLGTLGLNLVVLGPSLQSLLKSRRLYTEQAAVNAQNLAQVLEQNITGTIGKADVGISALAREAERQLAAGGIDPGRLASYMRAVESSLPELDGLRVADTRGEVVRGHPGQPINVADREYFQLLRQRPQEGLLVSKPLLGRVHGQWVVILAKRLARPDGSFAGVAFGSLPLTSIDHLFSSLQVGRHGAFALRDGTDLALLARYPEPEGIGSAVGHRQMSADFMKLLAKGQTLGSYNGPSGLDRRMRTWSYRKFSNNMYYVFVGLDRIEYLNEWRLSAERTALFLGAFAVVSILGAVAVFLGWKGRQASQAEQARLEQQLRNAERLESLGSLAGGIAHDMNNVLAAILGLASANLEAHAPDSRAYRAFNTIIKAALRGGQMVKSLLSLARQSPAEVQEININGLLQEEMHLLEHTTLSRIRLELDLAATLPAVAGDAGALSHAIINLCVNAVDAMPDQGQLTIRTRLLPNGWVEVQVADTGSGMPEAVLAKAMEPFFTTKAQGKGTGLGLAIVYSTVKAHRGQMEITSTPGRGTCVFLRFPPSRSAAAPEPVPAQLQVQDRPALEILLVDDDELVQASGKALLETLGHRSTLAASGEVALDLLAAGFRPDAVILDVNMPGLGGAATLPRLRTLLPGLPILLSTGRVDQQALELVGAHAPVTLLPKPFTLKDLDEALGGLKPSTWRRPPGSGAAGS